MRLNEPNSNGIKRPIATNEPAPRDLENAPNEPNADGIEQPIATNEPTAGPENAPNEPNSAGIDETNVTRLNTTICKILLEVPYTPPLTSLENQS